MENQSENAKCTSVIIDNSSSPSRKVGEIITFDGSLSKSNTDMEIHDAFGVICYNPAKTMPCGGYARTKYDQLPQRLQVSVQSWKVWLRLSHKA